MLDDIGTEGSLMLLFIGVILYFLPTINAKSRKHPSRGGIFALNLFLGWTFLGWVAAVIWSASSLTSSPEKSNGKASELEKLADLKERGHISEAEFEKEKSRILK